MIGPTFSNIILLLRWIKKYEELYSRVEPFMEQLDTFAAERALLLGQYKLPFHLFCFLF